MTFFDDTIDSLADPLNAALQALASKANWPEDVVSKIKIKTEDSKVQVVIPSDVRQQVDDLEYGDLEQPATYVLRKMNKVIERAVAEATVKAVYHVLLPGSEDRLDFSTS